MGDDFLKWYSQALGCAFGLIACIFGYLNGYMFVYSNIGNNFDFLDFGGVISSYLLLPICVITLLFSVMRAYYEDQSVLNIPFKYFNITLSTLTIILGFLGTKTYFIIPTLFISISFIQFHSFNKDNNLNVEEDYNQEFENFNSTMTYSNNQSKVLLDEINISIEEDSKEKRISRLNNTKKDIVTELLLKEAQYEFISEITGYTFEEIDIIKNEITSYID